MKQPHSIDYGVYIDNQQSFIISLFRDNQQHITIENVIGISEEELTDLDPFQNRSKEYISKLCRSIVNRLHHAHSLLIFGPAEAKYELRKILQSTGTIQLEEQEHLVTTEIMSEQEALRFSKIHVNVTSNVTKLS